jgi:hypothetical protein
MRMQSGGGSTCVTVTCAPPRALNALNTKLASLNLPAFPVQYRMFIVFVFGRAASEAAAAAALVTGGRCAQRRGWE